MRRLARYALNALTALSLLLCIATAAMWARSYGVTDVAALARGPSITGAVSTRGDLLLWRSTAANPSPRAIASPVLLYVDAPGAAPWWLSASNAADLLMDLADDMRPIAIGIADAISSLQANHEGWRIDDDIALNGKTYLLFDTELDSRLKKDEVLTVVQGKPFRVLGSLTVNRVDEVDARGKLMRSRDHDWERDSAETAEPSRPTHLGAIGHVTWAGAATGPRGKQLYAIRGPAPPAGVSRTFSTHRLLYVHGQAWGNSRTLVAFPHWFAVAVFAALASPLPFRTFKMLRRRIRRREGHCVACFYDLTGNVSGVCPECGTKAGAA